VGIAKPLQILFHSFLSYSNIAQALLPFRSLSTPFAVRSTVPNLENLCLESLTDEWLLSPGLVVPTIVDRSPPLRGRLRLVGTVATAQYPMDLAYELPNGINFRSVECVSVSGDHVQQILNGCAHTLEHLSIALSRLDGTRRLSFLSWL
jgi:hypothetical protein